MWGGRRGTVNTTHRPSQDFWASVEFLPDFNFSLSLSLFAFLHPRSVK